MQSLRDTIFVEKYRPQTLEELILKNKTKITKFFDNNKTIPNFLLVSNKPGTGKTSLARIIINMTNADSIKINASDDRGIDIIRQKVKKFAGALSTNGKRRCVFLDEAEGMTRQSQDSLKSIIETYADNTFFIFTANEQNKIIEPIRSRCIVIDFELPDKKDIYDRLDYICRKENMEVKTDDVHRLIDYNYPDIRSMINTLQLWHTTGKIEFDEDRFMEFWKALKEKNIDYIYLETYSGTFKLLEFIKFLFDKLFEYSDKYGLDKTSKMANEIAEVEKHYNIGANLEIIFLNSMLKIIRILNEK